MNARLNAGNGKAKPTEQKLRGGYYTPSAIADALAEWAIRDDNMRVLEPSCGDGSLLSPVLRKLGSSGRLVALEVDRVEADKASKAADPRVEIVVTDAFTWFNKHGDEYGSFDAVVGNPPFIRYQNFPEEHRQAAFHLMQNEGLHPTRLTNAWLPFVVLATAALRVGGTLALVLPAELLQVGYAGELREYLARKYELLRLVTFRRLAFDGIQQETVLLLGRRRDCEAAAISVLELDNLRDLSVSIHREVEGVPMDLEHSREKWIQYYLSRAELALIREIERSDVSLLGDLADIRVGVVTGRNDFFVLDPATADALGVAPWANRLVGRSAQIPGLEISDAEWTALRDANGLCLLLELPHNGREELPTSALAYVQQGEALGIHDGFKCRIRMPAWWQVPSTWVPEGFMLRQIHQGPRIIANTCGATSTDTIHRVRTKAGIDIRALAAASMNSMTWAFSEIRGRSYGGGVLELEPREATDLPFPPLTATADLAELDALVRQGSYEAALNASDAAVLRGMGLTKTEIKMLRGIWLKLSQRRLDRKA